VFLLVNPGRPWLVQVAPALVETATLMLEEPPSLNRPVCTAATMVLPNANESGSTWVACWLLAFVYWSELICVVAAAAGMAVPMTRAVAAAAVRLAADNDLVRFMALLGARP
jgi:hypothetical protein